MEPRPLPTPPEPTAPRPAWAALLTLAALSACVVVPRTTTVYDEDCKVYVRQMTLSAEEIGVFGACVNDGCVVLLVTAGVVAATSAVVSGSIAVVGNMVYWAEKQGRCARGVPAGPQAAAASAAGR